MHSRSAMTDAGFAWMTAGVWTCLLLAYRLRVARLGVFLSARVQGVGGTPLVGENIMNATYWAIAPVVNGLVRLGVTPNGVTWFALWLGIGAGVANAFGHFGLACLLATVSTICDILDGQIARAIKSDSARGELLDAVVDRYTEFAFIAGVMIYARDSAPIMVVALAALLASFMISYASAKAEALNTTLPRGVMRRHERAIFLILGAGITPILGPTLQAHYGLPETTPLLIGLFLVASIGNFAAVQRFTRIARLLP
jgi:CDP-diacylglycerol--glycerol-3-phosphate 3-phosphatidyltransferase